MLRIKDDVDLKELEKFGFNDKNVFETDWGGSIEIWGREMREVYIIMPIIRNTYEQNYGHIDRPSQDIIMEKLFDLIQAGIIEKADDFDFPCPNYY